MQNANPYLCVLAPAMRRVADYRFCLKITNFEAQGQPGRPPTVLLAREGRQGHFWAIQIDCRDAPRRVASKNVIFSVGPVLCRCKSLLERTWVGLQIWFGILGYSKGHMNIFFHFFPPTYTPHGHHFVGLNSALLQKLDAILTAN